MQSKQEINGENGPESMVQAMQRLYAEALRQGAGSREELVRDLDLPQSAAIQAFERLLALGLLEPRQDCPDIYDQRLLEAAEARAITPLRQALHDAQTRVDTVMEEFAALREAHEATRDYRSDDVLQVGAHDIDPMLEEAAKECRSEVLTAQPGGPRPVNILSQAQERDFAMLERGVSMRTIYQHSARFSPATEAYAARLVESGAEIRTLDTLFPRLIIFDQRIAFVPTRKGPGALCVRHQGVVSFFIGVFEMAWQGASPFASAYESRREGIVISDMQRAITRLLLVEDKDAAIARRLGISERSCRQHIAKLMAQLGARNRTHLGFLLASELRDEDSHDLHSARADHRAP
ncbi:helix-turn-helix transcriptional regulator [Streptomyces sp. HSG2]|uniref:helix-turn-helix domain-containing protein n=1 Tax=Streptomyces sp. HSG2 TaxID=2797167 RepID=UPI0019081E40|nr:helix-turn-helix transcriptional regulator [Streptomyces sp. HSG2]